jgi:hypothetical protein
MLIVAAVTVQYASELIMFVSVVTVISVTLFGGYLYLTAVMGYKFVKGTYRVYPNIGGCADSRGSSTDDTYN